MKFHKIIKRIPKPIKKFLIRYYIYYLHLFNFLHKTRYLFYILKLFIKTGQIKEYRAKYKGFTIFGDKSHLIPFSIEKDKNKIDWNDKLKIIRSILPEQTVIIDVGANVGVMSLLFSTLKDSKIYAIEPIKSNYKLLLKNLSYNQIKNVECFRLGMSNKKGNAFFGNPVREQGWRYSFFDSQDKAFSSIYAKKNN